MDPSHFEDQLVNFYGSINNDPKGKKKISDYPDLDVFAPLFREDNERFMELYENVYNNNHENLTMILPELLEFLVEDALKNVEDRKRAAEIIGGADDITPLSSLCFFIWAYIHQ